MKIKQEKPSFSDVESESESEPERLISPSKIKAEDTESVAAEDEATEDEQEAEPSVESVAAEDDAAEDEQEAEPNVRSERFPWSEEENVKALDGILSKSAFPGLMELKLKQYFKQFSHVKPLRPAKSWVDVDLANPDEETWIVQCPASVDIHSELLHKKLNLSAPRSRIKRCSVPLEAHVKRNSDEQAIGLMCGTRVKSFCPAGFVRIAETLPDAPVEVAIPTDSSHVEVPFPEDIRQRHPLLGYDFQSTMALPEGVKQRLELAREQAALFYTDPALAGRTKKSKSKSKRIKQEPDAVVVKIEPETEEEMETVSPKKSKKRQRPVEEEHAAAAEEPASKVIKQENGSPKKSSKHDQTEFNTVKKELTVEDDIAWLLNI